MTDNLEADVGDMLFGELPPEDNQTPIEPVAEQPQAQEPDPQPAPEPALIADPEPTQQPEQPKEAHSVPLAVLLDERDKAKAAKQEAERLRQQLAEYEARQTPQHIPDPYEDPQGYQSWAQAQFQQQAFNMRAEMSGRFAEQKFGKETVEKAIAWAQEQGRVDPFLGQRVQASQSPVEFVVEQFQREQFFKQYGSDPSALSALMANQQTAAPQPTPVHPAPKPQAPPRSLAAAPNAGGSQQEMPAGSIMDSIPLNLG